MNYIGLVALILGLISIFITFKYVDNYDRLYYQIEKKASNNLFKYPQELIDIQDELNLSDKDFKAIIVMKRKQIIEILKKVNKEKLSGQKASAKDNKAKENFIDFKIYLSSYQRRIPNTELTNLFKTAKKELDEKSLFSFNDESKLAEKAILKQDSIQSQSVNKYFSYSDLTPEYLSSNDVDINKSKSVCITKYNGNSYGRYINDEYLCDGQIVKNLICNS